MLFVPLSRRYELMHFFLLLDLDTSGLTGLEPAASALTGRCSDQLNYNPGEMQCNKVYSIHILMISLSIYMESPPCNKSGSDILIFTWIYWIYTLVIKEIGITSHLFIISNQSRIKKNLSMKKKKKTLFSLHYSFS